MEEKEPRVPVGLIRRIIFIDDADFLDSHGNVTTPNRYARYVAAWDRFLKLQHTTHAKERPPAPDLSFASRIRKPSPSEPVSDEPIIKEQS